MMLIPESLHPVGAVIKMAKRWTMPRGMKSVKMVEPEKKPRAKAKAKAQAELKFKDRCRGCCTKSRRDRNMTNSMAGLHRSQRTELTVSG